ncbi:hypothetical protein DM01DRAFT_1069034 [Hesseltinella vesiculosa]|uniref:Uncharacterized protein n=1 Tax=Hesseltinella vesiculosa TaxID=101127 RepID=A0A1X2GV69_9FUNG|nr:hypothetical protein DM01DRAFT_1069034 [Hesseltinella vesiculosa]
MDLSWCIYCDRHCVEENLYCSDACRIKDFANHQKSPASPVLESFPSSPNMSPLLEPFYSSFHEKPRSPSIMIARSPVMTNSSGFDLFPPISDT